MRAKSTFWSANYPRFGGNPITGVGGPVEVKRQAGLLAGSVHSDAYRILLKALVMLRNERSMSQADLAAKLCKPPSFVGKYELGERRLDVVELMVILRELDADFGAFWVQAKIVLPDRL